MDMGGQIFSSKQQPGSGPPEMQPSVIELHYHFVQGTSLEVIWFCRTYALICRGTEFLWQRARNALAVDTA